MQPKVSLKYEEESFGEKISHFSKLFCHFLFNGLEHSKYVGVRCEGQTHIVKKVLTFVSLVSYKVTILAWKTPND
jgi:hypothetical protein